MSRRETLAGVTLFLATGGGLLLAAWPEELFSFPAFLNPVMALLGTYGLAAVGLGLGWVNGFPRWSYPYAAYAVLFALYWTNMTTPGLTLFNHTFRRNELWGWRAWIPLLLAVVVALVVTRSLQPLSRAVREIRGDWTRLSFAVYGLMPLAVLLFLDEVRNLYEWPLALLGSLLLVLGAGAYLRSQDTRSRVLSLLTGAGATLGILAVGNGFYWHGRQEVWMAHPADGYREAVGVGVMGGVLLGFMFLPALLQLRPFHKPLSPG